MLQVQEHTTALHNVCQQLDSSATGKAAETRLQKALDKLHRIQQSAVPDSTGQHVKQEHGINPVRQTIAEAQPAELPVCGGNMSNSMMSTQLDSASGPASSHSKDGEDAVMADAVMPDGVMPDAVMADAVALDSAHPAATSEHEVVVPVRGKTDEGSVHSLELAGAAADKSKTAADKKAQKEEAKVCRSSKAAMFGVSGPVRSMWHESNSSNNGVAMGATSEYLGLLFRGQLGDLGHACRRTRKRKKRRSRLRRRCRRSSNAWPRKLRRSGSGNPLTLSAVLLHTHFQGHLHLAGRVLK